MRWAAGLEYVGTRYSGWQRQGHAIGVQHEVERVLSNVGDHSIIVTAAGRTDAGVHAFNQVIHFDSEARRAPHAWLFGANSQLPGDIGLRWVRPAPETFHARYSATARRYRYVILSSRARSAVLNERVCWLTKALDAPAMHRAAQALVGEHDFSAFRDADCQSPTAMRNVHAIRATGFGDFTVLDVQANAFLHHMVRNIAGVLIPIGLGERPESWCGTVLASRNRTAGGVTADAAGLYFVGPDYPAELGIPPSTQPWFPAVLPGDGARGSA